MYKIYKYNGLTENDALKHLIIDDKRSEYVKYVILNPEYKLGLNAPIVKHLTNLYMDNKLSVIFSYKDRLKFDDIFGH